MEGEDPQFARAERRIGSVLCGKYTVDRVLGVGGMAVVYAATHRNQKRVAIKMLHPELSLHDDIRRRFLREGYVANSVKHRGAVDVIDDDVAEDGAAFIVMELLDGAPLDAIVAKNGGTLPVAPAVAVAADLLAVLGAAHERGVVHRDVKPANLFVTVDGELKVLDFGIARLRDASSTHATHTGTMLGTPAYMPPEQARGATAEIGPATDVWSAGAALFTLLSGKIVHDAESAQMVVIKAATAPARSIATVLPTLAPAIASVVDRALAYHVADRWPSAAAMRTALLDAYRASHGDLARTSVLAALVGGAAKETTAPLPRVVVTPMHAAAAPAAPAQFGATTAAPVSASFVKPIASMKLVGAASGVVAAAAIGFGVLFAVRGDQEGARAALVPTSEPPPASAPAAPPTIVTASAAPPPSPPSSPPSSASTAAPAPAPSSAVRVTKLATTAKAPPSASVPPPPPSTTAHVVDPGSYR